MSQPRPFTLLLVVCFVLLFAVDGVQLRGATFDDGASNDKQPNIIFILADDQGWNGTSVQMHPDVPDSKSDYYRTPNLETLAASGVRFSHAYSPGPMCSPTRASLQTGKSPAQLRMTNVGRSRPANPSQKLILPEHSSTLSTDEITIGEQLQSAGYATAWFGKWHLGGDGPAAHGYDESDGPTGNADGVTEDPANPKDVFGITKRGIDFMEKNTKAGKPFYLQLWHYAVHGPVESQPKTNQEAENRAAGKTHNSASFAAMTEDLDTGVGMILEKVKELGIEDNTYIVYMSDHGAGRNLSSNSPLNQGKGTLWEGGMRVPLIISGPGVQAGEFCSVPTVGWDLFPTFCELAGIENNLPNGLEGVSLKPLFTQGESNGSAAIKPSKKRDAIAFHFPHYGQIGGSSKPHSTITIDGFKLIKFYEANQLHVFDLNKDLGEQTNLAKQMPEKTEMLHRRLNEYLKNVDAGMPKTNPDYDSTAVAQEGRGGRRRPGGANRQTRIAQLQKELAAIEEALGKDKLDDVGNLIADMKKAMEAAPSRGPGGAQGRGDSPREQRKKEIEQLEQAHQNKDTDKLRELITQMKERIESQPARPSGQRQRGSGQRPDQSK